MNTGSDQRGRLRTSHWVLLVCLAAGLLWWHERDPRFRGVPLGRWLDTYNAILSGQLTTPGWEETRTALKYFGNHGLAYFTKRLAYEAPGWQVRTLGRLDKAPPPFTNVMSRITGFWRKRVEVRQQRAKTAVMAFKFLGPYAVAAVPDLEHLAADPSSPKRARRAAEALGYLGQPGLSALARLNASKGLSSEDLGSPASYFSTMLAELENSARYSNAVVRRRALHSLALADTEGRAILFALLFDQDPVLRSETTNVVRDFYPELLKESPSFADHF